MPSPLRSVILAPALMVVALALIWARPAATSDGHVASGSCYEIYQATLTPGGPMTLCP